MVGVLLILAFTSHVSYLTFVSFDYGYNMAANATIGTVSFRLLFCSLHLKFNFTVINILCFLQRLLVPLSILTHCECCYLKTCLLVG